MEASRPHGVIFFFNLEKTLRKPDLNKNKPIIQSEVFRSDFGDFLDMFVVDAYQRTIIIQ